MPKKQYSEIDCSDLHEFLRKINLTTDTLAYRGIKNLKFDLVPSIGRKGFCQNKPDEVSNLEFFLLKDFKTFSRPFLNYVPSSDLEWYFLAQHHGIPTRLMDWTKNPLVALFFATEGFDEDDFAVYATFISQWKSPESTESLEDFFQIQKPAYREQNFIGVMPLHTHPRFANQRCLFTLQHFPTKSVVDQSITRFQFKGVQKSTIRAQLRSFGITKSFIYQTLDSVADEIRLNWMT